MSEFDPIRSLKDAGLLPDAPDNHHEEGHKGGIALEVLGTLTEDEVDVLKSVRARMDAAVEREDVVAHEETTGGGFW